MEKISTVKSVQGNGTFDWQDKTFYKFEIQFENGDSGDYNSIKEQQDKFIKGQETKYIFDNSKPNYPKIKPVWEPKASGGTFAPKQHDPRKEALIVKQVCVKAAAEMVKKNDPVEVIHTAGLLYNWIMEGEMPKTKKETTNLPF